MLELFHNDMSVCAGKVRIALAEKGLPWSSHRLDLRAGDALMPGYLKLNPAGVVPTLLHDGAVIRESNVICEYLDDAFPEPALRPPGVVERARMRLWTKQRDESVHAATGTVRMCIAFRRQLAQKRPAASRWLGGNSFSLADVACMPYAQRLKHLGLTARIEARRRVAAWAAAFEERNSWTEGLTRWLNPQYLELFAEAASAARSKTAGLLARSN